MNKKSYIIAIALATIAGISQLACLPNAPRRPSAWQQRKNLAEIRNRNAQDIYNLEAELFSYNLNSSGEYIPRWKTDEQFHTHLINRISSFVLSPNGYAILSNASSYEERPVAFYYHPEPDTQPIQAFIQRSKKHFIGLTLFTGIIEHLPANTKRLILDEIDSLSPDLHAQLLSEYLLISNPDDFLYAVDIPKEAASNYFRECQNQSRQPLFNSFLDPFNGKYNQLSAEEKADFIIISCENIQTIKDTSIREELIPLIKDFIAETTGGLWKLKPEDKLGSIVRILPTDIGKTSLKKNLLNIITDLLNEKGAEESLEQETLTKVDFLYSLISALDWQKEEEIHNFILNKMLIYMDKINIDNDVDYSKSESKKNLLLIALDLKIWHKDSSWSFKTQFSNWIQTYLKSEEYRNFLKVEKVELLSKIFKSQIWKNYPNQLQQQLFIIANEYTSQLSIALESWDQDGVDIYNDATTQLEIPIDLENDTFLITAILDSGFWLEYKNELTDNLCSLCLTIIKHEIYEDLLSPILQSKLFEHNEDLAKKVVFLAIEKFNGFAGEDVPHLPRAQASLATRVINSGIWKYSEELVVKLKEAYSMAIQGMEDDPVEDDEEAILEMADDHPIESNDKERTEALLDSITESEIWKYWI